MIIVYGHEINVILIYKINWVSFHYYMFLNRKCESEVLVSQLCPTLCGRMDGSPQDSTVYGNL